MIPERYGKSIGLEAISCTTSKPPYTSPCTEPNYVPQVGDAVAVVEGGDGGHSVGTVGKVVDDNSQESIGVEKGGRKRWHRGERLKLVFRPLASCVARK